MLAGPVVYPLAEASSVLRRYSEIAAIAPDELGLPVSLNSRPDGSPLLLILPLWNCDEDHGERLVHDLGSSGTPQLAQVGPTTYTDMLTIFDTAVDAFADCHWAARTRSLPAPLPTGAIDVIVRAAANRTPPYSMVDWHDCHGASTRVPPDATAFGLRQEHSWSRSLRAGCLGTMTVQLIGSGLKSFGKISLRMRSSQAMQLF
jgi:hypothetical protein